MIGTVWSRGLLVSVRNADEAVVAAAAAAAIIDVKEPDRGPLGRADPAVTAAILAAVAGRAPVTLAAGELAAGVDAIIRHVADVLERLPDEAARPVAVKAGPAGVATGSWRDSFARLSAGLPTGIEPVAVAYADSQSAAAPPPEVILEQAVEAGVTTVLVDTFDKRGPGLFSLATADRLRSWIAQAAVGGVSLALAGRLSAADVGAGFDLGAAVCGVRTAACRGGRQGRVSAQLVRGLATLGSRARPHGGAAESLRRW
jgi:(5-formylfuran-3-yl)methyl phosphate synthase